MSDDILERARLKAHVARAMILRDNDEICLTIKRARYKKRNPGCYRGRKWRVLTWTGGH